MENNINRPMTPFDEQTIPSNLHTLKLLLPYTPVPTQRSLGILIKFLELMHTIRFFQRFGRLPETAASPNASPIELLENLSNFLTPEESELVEQFRSILNMMEMFSMMQEFQDFSGETDFSDTPSGHSKDDASPDSSEHPTSSAKKSGFFGNGNPMEMLMGMLSPEQQEMFHTYQNIFSDSETINNTTSSKEDETNG